MTVKLIGSLQHYERIPTGSFSLDRALSGGPRGLLIPGFPMRTITEVSGRPMAGKSTFVLWLAGRIAQSKHIAGAYLEEYDEEMVKTILEESGYNGEMHLIEGVKDEDYIDNLDVCMADEAFSVGIWDSIGAILAISEVEGKAGEANMGRRALLVSKLMRRARKDIRNRKSPFSLICTNHTHPNIGSVGNTISGGEKQKFMSSNLIELSTYHDDIHFFEEDGSFIIDGYCRKVKFGPSYRKFKIFNLAGYGPHLGLSAVVDCITDGLATKEKKQPIKLNGKSFGQWKELIRAAKKGETEIFQPFKDQLRKLETNKPAEEPKKRGRKKR